MGLAAADVTGLRHGDDDLLPRAPRFVALRRTRLPRRFLFRRPPPLPPPAAFSSLPRARRTNKNQLRPITRAASTYGQVVASLHGGFALAGMASPAGGGADDRSPALSPAAAAPAAPRAVVDGLMEMREHAAMLQSMLQGSPAPPSAAGGRDLSAAELVDGMMSVLSSAMSALDTGGGGASSSSTGGRGAGGRTTRKKQKAAGAVAAPHRRTTSSCRRRSWRKYGQKFIQGSPNNPRSYYRCTHRPDQGCRATRQVQASEANPSEFVISYFGEHTCRDPSTMPLIIDAAAPADGANLISFGRRSTTVAAMTTSTHQATMDPMMMMLSGFVGYSFSLPAAAHDGVRCGSEGALSSSSPAAQQPAVVAPSATVVGSAPAEFWPVGAADMAGGDNGAGSFPSSPSSLGFMTGSFGSFGNGGDDDLFGFDL
ncbi:hypothetical protein ACP4OV_007438 [Aristida adscensionis]